ncbi:MAG: Maf family protein [Synergistaceae bacterium]|jgi:septum formation protein|nr:Maf family protein [Synergistaceae bacterium]
MPRLILASESPRRRKLLALLGLPFEAVSHGMEETEETDETPAEMVLRLSKLKALAVSSRMPDACVIGADTVVDVDGQPLLKPLNRRDAVRMLNVLNGRSHKVHTGVALARNSFVVASSVETTEVVFGDLSEDEILSFVSSGDGDDKAGAYAIQERGALLVEKIDGCYYNVVGLPVYKLMRLLDKFVPDVFRGP